MVLHSARFNNSVTKQANVSNLTNWRDTLRRLVAFLPWARKYEHHNSRAGMVADTLSDEVEGTILDVGAGRNATPFTDVFGSRYHPLDMGQSYHIDGRSDLLGPDTVVDLENAPLPFEDRSFGTVVCTDVLEHIDNIYHAYDELFRVAEHKVIISLPNNWVFLPVSILRGKNASHTAGYGLPPKPKGVGERHKYWFNFEEAADFMVGRAPGNYVVKRFESRFEYGSDSLLCGVRPFALLVRTIEMGNFFKYAKRDFTGIKRVLVMVLGPLVYAIVRPLDVILSGIIWGFGSKTRFHNLFCRQVWCVFERIPAGSVTEHR